MARCARQRLDFLPLVIAGQVSAAFLEETNAYNLLDLSVPLYGTNNNVTPQNAAGVAIVVPLFLCPSDVGQPITPQFGPTNYAACAGTGINGGSPLKSDGVFYVNSRTRMAEITDGASHTALFSESILGTPDSTAPAHPGYGLQVHPAHAIDG